MDLKLTGTQVIVDPGYGGIKLVKNDDDSAQIIVAIFNGGTHTFHLGQRVYASGRIFVPKGTLGIIVKINTPGGLFTCDILRVHFEGQWNPSNMKPKDLEAPSGLNPRT